MRRESLALISGWPTSENINHQRGNKIIIFYLKRLFMEEERAIFSALVSTKRFLVLTGEK